MYSSRQSTLEIFFIKYGNFVVCKGLNGLMIYLNITDIDEEWSQFTDISKLNLKNVLFQ